MRSSCQEVDPSDAGVASEPTPDGTDRTGRYDAGSMAGAGRESEPTHAGDEEREAEADRAALLGDG